MNFLPEGKAAPSDMGEQLEQYRAALAKVAAWRPAKNTHEAETPAVPGPEPRLSTLAMSLKDEERQDPAVLRRLVELVPLLVGAADNLEGRYRAAMGVPPTSVSEFDRLTTLRLGLQRIAGDAAVVRRLAGGRPEHEASLAPTCVLCDDIVDLLATPVAGVSFAAAAPGVPALPPAAASEPTAVTYTAGRFQVRHASAQAARAPAPNELDQDTWLGEANAPF